MRLLCCLAVAAAPLLAQDTTGAFFTAKDGVKIHYTVEGAGPAVVLVHGFLNDGSSWRRTPVPEKLRAAGRRVVIVDLRGNGPSDKPVALEAYDDDAETRDVMGVVSALGIREYCAIGYSRGSIITARLLVRDDRLRCAVLGGMGDGFTDPNWPRRLAAYRALAGLPQDSADAAPVLGMVRAAEQRGLSRQVLAAQQHGQPSTSPAELGRVRRPVLMINGDADRDNGDIDRLFAMIPGAVRVTVPGDHGGTLRTPAFADSVVAFVLRAASRR